MARKDEQEGLKDYQRAKQLDPDPAKSALYWAEIQFTRDQNDDALRSAREAIKLNPQLAQAYFILGQAQVLADDYDGAIESYSQAIALSPDSPYAYTNRALAQYWRGDQQLAIQDFGQTIEADPTFAGGYISRGLFGLEFDHQAYLTQTIDDLTTALSLSPEIESPMLNEQLLTLGVKHCTKPTAMVAVAMGSLSLLLIEPSSDAYYVRACARYTAAYELDESAGSLNARALEGRGRAYTKLGNIDAYVADFYRVAEAYLEPCPNPLKRAAILGELASLNPPFGGSAVTGYELEAATYKNKKLQNGWAQIKSLQNAAAAAPQSGDTEAYERFAGEAQAMMDQLTEIRTIIQRIKEH